MWVHSFYTPMCQSYSSSLTPSLVTGVLEARPISASIQKTVIWGPSWISSWALLTNTALDHQWLEEGEEPSLSKFAPRDHQLRPETPQAPGNKEEKKNRPWSCQPATTRSRGLSQSQSSKVRKISWLLRLQTLQKLGKLQMKSLTATLTGFHSWMAQLRHFKYNHCRLKAITKKIVKYLMKVNSQNT